MAGFGVDIEVDITGDEIVKKAIKELRKKMSETAAIRKIARAGRKTMVNSIKRAQASAEKDIQEFNRYDRSRKYYSPSGAVSTFYRGHLEKSIRDVSQDKSKWRKYPVLYIGPVYTGKAGAGGQFTGEKGSADAFYAHMMLGSKEAYAKRVLQTGFQAAKNQAGQEILQAARKEVEKSGKKAGFK